MRTPFQVTKTQVGDIIKQQLPPPHSGSCTYSLLVVAHCLLKHNFERKAGLRSGVKGLSGTSGARTGDLKLDQCRIPKWHLKS